MSVLDGCVTLECKSGCLTIRKRVSNPELHEIRVYPGIARMKCLARSRVWWVSLDVDLEAKVQTCTKCQSSRRPELVPCPDPLTHVRGSGVLSDFSCQMGQGSSPI